MVSRMRLQAKAKREEERRALGIPDEPEEDKKQPENEYVGVLSIRQTWFIYWCSGIILVARVLGSEPKGPRHGPNIIRSS